MLFRGNIYSKELDMDTSITVVMPREFKGDNPHKVVYMLHGLSGNSSNWSDNTMMSLYSSEYNVVFVMPEGGRSFYTDMKYGLKYFSYVSNELPELCKNIFNISTNREDIAIMGLSMGGYGALKCALSKPEQYSLCCAFSSGCLFLKELLDEQRKGNVTMDDFKFIFGPDFEWKTEDEILELAQKASQGTVKPIIHTTCGTEDSFYQDNLRFSKVMKTLDLNYSYEEWGGAHDWYFWNDSLKYMLEKYYVSASV